MSEGINFGPKKLYKIGKSSIDPSYVLMQTTPRQGGDDLAYMLYNPKNGILFNTPVGFTSLDMANMEEVLPEKLNDAWLEILRGYDRFIERTFKDFGDHIRKSIEEMTQKTEAYKPLSAQHSSKQ